MNLKCGSMLMQLGVGHIFDIYKLDIKLDKMIQFRDLNLIFQNL
jgi:hypothetical protein